MASLKALKIRIGSVKSTQKITKAMKMVAAAKLRRAQEAAVAGRPYAERLEKVVASLAARVTVSDQTPKLLAGTGRDDVHLLIVTTSERGLAGAFNSNIIRAARRKAEELIAAGKTVKILTVGKKGRVLRRFFPKNIAGDVEMGAIKYVAFSDAQEVANEVIRRFEAGEFDVAQVPVGELGEAGIDLLPGEAEILAIPIVEFDRQFAHGFIAPFLDIGEDSLDRSANLPVRLGTRLNILAALEPDRHGSSLLGFSFLSRRAGWSDGVEPVAEIVEVGIDRGRRIDPFAHRLAIDRVLCGDGQHHDALGGSAAQFLGEVIFLDVVPVPALGIPTDHHDVIGLAGHHVRDAGRHDDDVARRDAHAQTAAAEKLDLHPAGGHAEAFMGGRVEVSVGINAGIAPVIVPAVGSQPRHHSVRAAVWHRAAMHQQRKAAVGQHAFGLRPVLLGLARHRFLLVSRL